MGSSISKVFKTTDQSLQDGARSAMRSGSCGGDLTSKSTASSEDSQPRRRGSLEDTMAAIQSANAFFDGCSLASKSSPPNDRKSVGGVSHRRQKHNRVAATFGRSQPVPVKGALRRQQIAQEDHIGRWRDHDDSDTQYLKRLYEMRTWDMWVRITEARKRQKVDRHKGGFTGEGPPS